MSQYYKNPVSFFSSKTLFTSLKVNSTIYFITYQFCWIYNQKLQIPGHFWSFLCNFDKSHNLGANWKYKSKCCVKLQLKSLKNILTSHRTERARKSYTFDFQIFAWYDISWGRPLTLFSKKFIKIFNRADGSSHNLE